MLVIVVDEYDRNWTACEKRKCYRCSAVFLMLYFMVYFNV